MTPLPRKARPIRAARRTRHEDEGSALILGIGVLVVCLTALAVLADASVALLQRQRLLALADGAALAGAQALDVSAYYASGASAATALDPAAVARAVQRHLALSTAEGTRLVAVESDGTDVRVTMAGPIRTPFLGALFDGDITVQSRARLAYRGAA